MVHGKLDNEERGKIVNDEICGLGEISVTDILTPVLLTSAGECGISIRLNSN